MREKLMEIKNIKKLREENGKLKKKLEKEMDKRSNVEQKLMKIYNILDSWQDRFNTISVKDVRWVLRILSERK